MRKAAKIVLLVGGIVNILGAVLCLGLVALSGLLVVAGLAAGIAPFAGELADLISAGDMEVLTAFLQENASAIVAPVAGGIVGAIALALSGLLGFVLSLVTGITCLIGSKAKPAKKGIHIVNIVFGVLNASLLALAGGVLGLIAAIKEKKLLPEEPAEEPAEEPVAEAE